MSSRREEAARNIDWITLSLYIGLVLVGWLMIAAVGNDHSSIAYADLNGRAKTQLFWIGLSLAGGALAIIFESRLYRSFAYPIYGISLLMLVLVLIFGQEVAGSRSWFNLGGIKFQPSELAKFGACLGLAGYLGSFHTDLKQFRTKVIALAIIFAPMVLILIQGDAGSALVFTSFFIVLFREGMPAPLYVLGGILIATVILSLIFNPLLVIGGAVWLSIAVLVTSLNKRSYYLIAAFLAIAAYALYFMLGAGKELLGITGGAFALFLILMFSQKKRQIAGIALVGLIGISALSLSVNQAYNFLKPHQQDRIDAWLNPHKCEPLGSLYNLTQSKLAIGSGGLVGKGYLNGDMTMLEYVPEQATDFIFCTVGEEQGFVGALAVIFLYLALILRTTVLAERQRSQFTRVYAYGVAGILFFHFLVNIGMTLGLMPVIGIPLPFLSYGGSSLLSFTILLAVLLKLDSNRLLVFR